LIKEGKYRKGETKLQDVTIPYTRIDLLPSLQFYDAMTTTSSGSSAVSPVSSIIHGSKSYGNFLWYYYEECNEGGTEDYRQLENTVFTQFSKEMKLKSSRDFYLKFTKYT
jgi:hypothetical protein